MMEGEAITGKATIPPSGSLITPSNKWEIKPTRRYNPAADGIAESSSPTKLPSSNKGAPPEAEALGGAEESDEDVVMDGDSDDEIVNIKALNGKQASTADDKAARKAEKKARKEERRREKAEKLIRKAEKAARRAEKEAKRAAKAAKKDASKPADAEVEESGKKRKAEDQLEEKHKKKKDKGAVEG